MSARQSSLEKMEIRPFAELSLTNLHDILRLRVDVFVVEQKCAYPEIDGLDPQCFHLVGTDAVGHTVATARIAPAGLIYDEWSIGRVAVAVDHRKHGWGKSAMEASIEFCVRQGVPSIKIAAQTYLEKFYSDLGFSVCGEPFLWDGIMHVHMRLILPIAK